MRADNQLRAHVTRWSTSMASKLGGQTPYNQHEKCALAAQVPDRRTAGRFRGRYAAY